MRSVESFSKSAGLVWPCDEEVEERDDCTFEFFAPTCIDGGGGESTPDNGFADTGRDEEGDTAA